MDRFKKNSKVVYDANIVIVFCTKPIELLKKPTKLEN